MIRGVALKKRPIWLTERPAPLRRETPEPALKPLLVCEAPSRRHSAFSGPSFDRLALMLGDAIGGTFELMNLIPLAPAPGKAHDSIDMQLCAEDVRRALAGRRVVFFGARVAAAFGFEEAPLHWSVVGSFDAAILPVPGAIDRWWNDPRNVVAAGEFLRAIATAAPSNASVAGGVSANT